MIKLSNIYLHFKSTRVISIAGASSLVVAIVVSLQGCVSIPAAALQGSHNPGLPPQRAGEEMAHVGGSTIFDALQASSPSDASTFAYAVKSLTVGQATMAQAQLKLGKPIMANKTDTGTSWIYTLADKTKAPDMVFGAAQATRTANFYKTGGSGFLQFDNNGILRGVQVVKMSEEAGVSTTETIYSRGQLSPKQNCVPTCIFPAEGDKLSKSFYGQFENC